MKRMMTLAALTAMLLAGGAQAAEHEVKMLNKGDNGAMVFVPELVKIAPGDTVRFVPTDKATMRKHSRYAASRRRGLQKQNQ